MTQKRAFMPLYIVLGQQWACMPVYIGKSGDLVGCYRCLTHSQTENSATQLVSSIKLKLSHAIQVLYMLILIPSIRTFDRELKGNGQNFFFQDSLLNKGGPFMAFKSRLFRQNSPF